MKDEANHVDRRLSPGGRDGRGSQDSLTIVNPSKARFAMFLNHYHCEFFSHCHSERSEESALEGATNQVRRAPSFARSARKGGRQRPNAFGCHAGSQRGVVKQ